MVKIYVDGNEYEVREGVKLLEALRDLGFEIPTLCNLEGVHSPGACRMCVVEVEGMRNLQASCVSPVSEGMRVLTSSERVMKSRKMNVELLIANHPDCLTCRANGHCELQRLAEVYNVKRIFKQNKKYEIDDSAPAYYRDNTKCILCERCVAVCEVNQAVNTLGYIGRGNKVRIGNPFDMPISDSQCIQCGQCVLHCPTGALVEKDEVEDVLREINDKEKFVVVQTAPAVRASLGEYFGLDAGALVTGKLVRALRLIGFDKVLDTTLGADFTIMEEGHEFLERITKLIKGEDVNVPQFTSCCPGWVKYVEEFYPELIPNLSTAKSPHQMFGALIKGYYAKRFNVKKDDVVVVSIMPCTAKKYESRREELRVDGMNDVDYVLTTRELGKLIEMKGIDFLSLEDDDFDDIGRGSGAGDIFGVTGGVMEAALRTAYELYTGKRLDNVEFEQIRGLEGVKEGSIIMNEVEIRFAVASGISNAIPLINDVLDGKSRYHFIEVMACPGGCINGGGQPKYKNNDVITKRMKAIYESDRGKPIRRSYENPNVKIVYDEFLGKPLGKLSEKYLHTHYVERKKV